MMEMIRTEKALITAAAETRSFPTPAEENPNMARHLRVLRKAAVVLGLTATALHGSSAATHNASTVMAAVLLIMMIACLPCLLKMWTSSSPANAGLAMVMSLAMVLTHSVWLLSPSPGHAHGARLSSGSTVDWIWLFLVWVASELATSALCAAFLRKSRQGA